MVFGLDTTDSTKTAAYILGTEKIRPFLETFKSHGHVEIDTARAYGNGDTEQARRQNWLT